MTWDTMWQDAFNQQVSEVQEKSGSNPVDWRRSGTATKANPDKEDGNWWNANGKTMFFDFINAWSESGMDIWVAPQGIPGIEIEFNQMFGDVPIKAFADLIATEGNEIVVIDFKTGKYMPDSSMQLGLYACCMEMQFGIRPTKGYFYSARKATFMEATNLDRWTIPLFTELFAQFKRGIDAEIFLPSVGMNCVTCSVKEYCHVQGGQLAQIYDPLANIKKEGK
jgi:CRISPR/Cas system-associated exonuclease Cas4 (RecB family)